MNAMIQVENVTVGYSKNTVLQEVSATVYTNDFVIFFGGNGSGKSTLVKAMLGLIPFRSGRIVIKGKPLSRVQVAQHIGYVPQYTTIDRDFPISVREIIKLSCLQGNSCITHPEQHLEYLNSSYLVDRNIQDLSGGELQRVLIARSLVNNPDILIFDEPTNNLDRQTQFKLYDLLKKLHEVDKKTIVVVSHDQHIVEYIQTERIVTFENQNVLETDHFTNHYHSV